MRVLHKWFVASCLLPLVGCGGGSSNSNIIPNIDNITKQTGTAAAWKQFRFNDLAASGKYVYTDYTYADPQDDSTIQQTQQTGGRFLQTPVPAQYDTYNGYVNTSAAYWSAYADRIRAEGEAGIKEAQRLHNESYVNAFKNPYQSKGAMAFKQTQVVGARNVNTTRSLDTSLNLYYKTIQFTDGSQRLNYYQDAAYTKSAGYSAIDAPQWRGGKGIYPVLLRSVSEFTVNGSVLRTANVIVVNDANAQTGSIATLTSDAQGNALLERTVVDAGGVTQYNTIMTPAGGLEVDASKDQSGTYTVSLQASDGSEGALIVKPDGSGGEAVSLNGSLVFYIIWDSSLAGYYVQSDGVKHMFSNVATLLQSGKAVQAHRLTGQNVPLSPAALPAILKARLRL